MPEDRRVDRGTRDRIDEMHAENEAEFERIEKKLDQRADDNADSIHRAITVFIVAALFFGIGISVVGLIFRHQNDQRVNDIQNSRRESAGLACMETNTRHDNALIEFDKLLLRAINVKPATYSKSLPSAVRLDRYDRALQFAFTMPRVKRLPTFRQMKASAVTTPLLINALVPRRDCEAYVRRLIK